MITAGRDQGLMPRQVVATVRPALTAAHPGARYAPARHPLVEQALIRVLPRRLMGRAMGRHLGRRGNR